MTAHPEDSCEKMMPATEAGAGKAAQALTNPVLGAVDQHVLAAGLPATWRFSRAVLLPPLALG